MNVWMRGRSASLTAFYAASMSWWLVRARPQMTGPSTSRAIASTASKSPGEVIGKPASITSTPSRASCWAISSFSLLVQRDARRLLAVAQRRVEDQHAVGLVACALCCLPCSCRSCSFSNSLAVPLCWVCGYAAATRYSPRGGSRRSERSEFERHLIRRLAPPRRPMDDRPAAGRGEPQCSQGARQNDLADIAPLGDHRLRGAGVLEGEVAGDDRFDRAVVEHLAQRRDPRLQACRGPSTA